MTRPRILTWQIHGSYLEALAHAPIEIYLPVLPGEPNGFGGRGTLNLPSSVHDVPVAQVPDLELDAVLFQSRQNYLSDQYQVLTPEQQRLPRAYLEHDPPRDNPTDERHVVDDPEVTIVHVTQFNALMWDSGASPVQVIEHGVEAPGIPWRGDQLRGVTVFNDLATRGRRAGLDLFLAARDELPIDLVGLRSEALGGRGAFSRADLPRITAGYRFFFHPARYTSLGLSLIEAMLLGMPIVAPATTELVTVIEDGRNGIVATDPARLLEGMRKLLRDRDLAARLGAAGRETALARFGIDRFARDWAALFTRIIGRPAASPQGVAA
jgi:glycosyltransferase involved in cell wall biosynthesis